MRLARRGSISRHATGCLNTRGGLGGLSENPGLEPKTKGRQDGNHGDLSRGSTTADALRRIGRSDDRQWRIRIAQSSPSATTTELKWDRERRTSQIVAAPAPRAQSNTPRAALQMGLTSSPVAPKRPGRSLRGAELLRVFEVRASAIVTPALVTAVCWSWIVSASRKGTERCSAKHRPDSKMTRSPSTSVECLAHQLSALELRQRGVHALLMHRLQTLMGHVHCSLSSGFIACHGDVVCRRFEGSTGLVRALPGLSAL